MDEASGFCIGCARTRQEIRDWRGAETALDQIWAELPGRRAQLGISLHRLEWTRESILGFIEDTLRSDAGTWVFGTFGAVAEFCVGPGEAVEVALEADGIVAQTLRGAIRLEILDEVRALRLTNAGATQAQPLILAVPASRAGSPHETGLTVLGLDRDAIRATDRAEVLYDLGLGMESARFCIRTGDDELNRMLEARVGCGWPELLCDLGPRILESSPTRVITSPIGRIEVFTPIPPPGGHSPDGPHTHFLPAHIAIGRETPPGMDLPSVLRAGAFFYPGHESCDG